MRGLFVTGTDTGIGKTTVSAALVHRYRRSPVGYWKPVQTGFPEDDDTRDVALLSGCPEQSIYPRGVRLPRPLSPHLSARLAGERIEMNSLLDMAQRAPAQRFWIVEGAGGVLVPLNESDLMVDLIAALQMPALIVARSQLGTINHTLLTVEALRRRAIPIAGVVMSGEPNPENRDAVQKFGDIAVVGEMPRFESLTPAALQGWAESEFDTEGRVADYLSTEK
jgi:dethiobiotin synthase